MTRMRTATICLVAAFATWAGTASVAMAVLPEVGRCVKVAKTTGEFKTAGCTGGVAAGGSYDWLAGAGEHSGFIVKAGRTKVEAGPLGSIECAKGQGTGTITSPSTDVISVTFSKCASGGKRCTSEGSPTGAMQVSNWKSIWVDRNQEKTGLPPIQVLVPGESSVVTSGSCEGTAFRITGAVVGSAGGNVNKMARTNTLAYVVSEGVQGPSTYLSREGEVLAATLETEVTIAPEVLFATTLTSVCTNKYEEKLEVKSEA